LNLPEGVGVEIPLNEEEIVHDEGIGLREFVNAAHPVDPVDFELLAGEGHVAEVVEVDEEVHGDVEGVPEC
jgi:hypothetical protein